MSATMQPDEFRATPRVSRCCRLLQKPGHTVIVLQKPQTSGDYFSDFEVGEPLTVSGFSI